MRAYTALLKCLYVDPIYSLYSQQNTVLTRAYTALLKLLVR